MRVSRVILSVLLMSCLIGAPGCKSAPQHGKGPGAPTSPGSPGSEDQGQGGPGAGPVDGNDRSNQGKLAPLEPSWTYPLERAVKGFAVHPTQGYLFVSVQPFGTGAFARSGGVLALRPENGKKAGDIPITISTGQGSMNKVFRPNAPLISGDGKTLFVGSYSWDIFKFDLTDLSAIKISQIVVPSETSEDHYLLPGDQLIGIDANAALSEDARKIYLAGSQLYEFDTLKKTVKPLGALGSNVKQAVKKTATAFLLNLTDEAAPEGRFGVWFPSVPRFEAVEIGSPLRALASNGKWDVGVLEHEGYCVLTHIWPENGDYQFDPIGAFKVHGDSKCTSVTLALHPERKQIVIGALGSIFHPEEVGTPSENEEFSGLIVDIERKMSAKAKVQKVESVAVSPDGKRAYFAGPTGVAAFEVF